MFSKVKNFFISFIISFAVFGVVALIVVDIVMKCIGGAFTLDGLDFNTPGQDGNNQAAVSLGSGGESLYFLAVITDYRPSFYGDYDYKYIQENFGSVKPGKLPGDISSVDSSSIKLSEAPEAGTVDDTSDKVNIIGGIKENNYRTIHNDITVLVRMDKERKQFTFTYFPKDTVISYGDERVLFRDIYYKYGIGALMDVVHSVTGIRPDRHIIVHSEYVDDIIDSIGGLDLMVSVPMKQTSPENGIDLELAEGLNTLNGDEAVQYINYDNYDLSSFSLERAGLVFVRAFISRLTQPAGYVNAGTKFTIIRQYCVTDMLVSDITDNRDVWYGYAQYGKQQLDIKGKYITLDGKRMFEIDTERTLNQFVQYKKLYNKK